MQDKQNKKLCNLCTKSLRARQVTALPRQTCFEYKRKIPINRFREICPTFRRPSNNNNKFFSHSVKIGNIHYVYRFLQVFMTSPIVSGHINSDQWLTAIVFGHINSYERDVMSFETGRNHVTLHTVNVAGDNSSTSRSYWDYIVRPIVRHQNLFFTSALYFQYHFQNLHTILHKIGCNLMG